MPNITDQLPYELCTGIAATRDGIEPSLEKLQLIRAIAGDSKLTHGPRRRVDGHGVDWRTYWSWQDAKEVLQYHPGQPWAEYVDEYWPTTEPVEPYIHCANEHESDMPHEYVILDRYAAILCRDAAAFYVLYQCIKEFGYG